MRNETRIQTLRDSNPDAETIDPSTEFEIGENALESNGLITDIGADVPEWLV